MRIDWNQLATTLLAFVQRATEEGHLTPGQVKSFLLCPSTDWVTLELWCQRELGNFVNVSDREAFAGQLVAEASLAAWLDAADAVAPTGQRLSPLPWGVRLENQQQTEAMDLVLGDLVSGLKKVTLELARQLSRFMPHPVALFAGFSGEASVLTFSSADPALAMPVECGGDAWAALRSAGLELFLEDATRAQLVTRASVQSAQGQQPLVVTFTNGERLELNGRYGLGEDAALWGLVESRDAIDRIAGFFNGTTAGPDVEWQPERAPVATPSPVEPKRLAQFEAAVSAWLTDEAATVPDHLGAVRTDVWASGVRLFFFEPVSIPSLISVRHVSSIEKPLDELIDQPQPSELAGLQASLAATLFKHPATVQKASGRLLVTSRTDADIEVREQRFGDRAWAPLRRPSQYLAKPYEEKQLFG